MTPETSQALEDSIAHWERLVAGAKQEDETIYSSSCALCKLFLKNRCIGCPVMVKTGLPVCRNTPWNDCDEVLDQYGYNSPEFRAAAAEQLEFLKSLREEVEK